MSRRATERVWLANEDILGCVAEKLCALLRATRHTHFGLQYKTQYILPYESLQNSSIKLRIKGNKNWIEIASLILKFIPSNLIFSHAELFSTMLLRLRVMQKDCMLGPFCLR